MPAARAAPVPPPPDTTPPARSSRLDCRTRGASPAAITEANSSSSSARSSSFAARLRRRRAFPQPMVFSRSASPPRSCRIRSACPIPAGTCSRERPASDDGVKQAHPAIVTRQLWKTRTRNLRNGRAHRPPAGWSRPASSRSRSLRAARRNPSSRSARAPTPRRGSGAAPTSDARQAPPACCQAAGEHSRAAAGAALRADPRSPRPPAYPHAAPARAPRGR